MRLTPFQVSNYRSVEDSGRIEVADRTALVGRNESGKTNLLLALAALKPPSGVGPLNEVKDLPRERNLSTFNKETPFVRTEWELTDDEAMKLAERCPSLAGQKQAIVGQRYDGNRFVSFPDSKPLDVDLRLAGSHAQKAQRALRTALGAMEESTAKRINDAAGALKAKSEAPAKDATEWATATMAALQQLRKAAAEATFKLPEEVEGPLNELQDYCEEIQSEKDRQGEVRSYVAGLLPVFIFLDEYPDLHGRQNLAHLVERLGTPKMTPSDHSFMKLMKVAGLDPKNLRDLLAQGAEKRQLLTNRASATVTSKIRELWRDRELTVRFALDAENFDILVSDPTAIYPVEVNLEERSRGFRWFFSFFITFAADTQGGPAKDAILLLDEPGLYLHAMAQGDLLRLFRTDFKNQILYTTHSPFMIPVDELGSIRTVNIAPKVGTTVSNDPMGDPRTLFPLQSALGYTITQALFVGSTNVVIEGVTDYWYISAASDYLASLEGRSHLSADATLTPVGGAQKVSYMVALLASQSLRVVVLLDSEKKSRETAAELAKQKLIRDEYILFVGKSFSPEREQADIEDLLDPAIFEGLVRESYRKELAGKTLTLNASIPGVVKRFDQAFAELGIEFHKTRPARLFLRKMAENPAAITGAGALERFEVLLKLLNDRLGKLASAPEAPFAYAAAAAGKTSISI